jgi:N-acetylmuramoyl-L-alanine amidase
MVLRKFILSLSVVSLFGTSMFLGFIEKSYAASTDKNIISVNLENSLENLTDPAEDLTTSKILLENNETVDKFVKSHALSIESIVESQKKSPVGQKTFSNKEIELMAKMVYGEARGEPIKGQVAVAAVILNRVASTDFPDTVANVLFQDGAFTAVIDGQFNQSPDYEAYRAVYLAIKGKDPTKNAVFYYNPTIATSAWIFSRPQTTKIGEHVFAK